MVYPPKFLYLKALNYLSIFTIPTLIDAITGHEGSKAAIRSLSVNDQVPNHMESRGWGAD